VTRFTYGKLAEPFTKLHPPPHPSIPIYALAARLFTSVEEGGARLPRRASESLPLA
jgi:hypothetical protein